MIIAVATLSGGVSCSPHSLAVSAEECFPNARGPNARGPTAESIATAPVQLAACRSVAHIGDSLTAYVVAPLKAAYAAVGVKAEVDAYGGRAILQKLSADPKTGRQAAVDLVRAGFKGCWVVALGSNDTANVAVGAAYSRSHAIDEMMKAIDPSAEARVVWVNAFTTKASGPWSNENMKLWNGELEKARERWPNLEVFDWASVAATGVAPYDDGIHHTKEGYEVRNKAIADALEENDDPRAD